MLTGIKQQQQEIRFAQVTAFLKGIQFVNHSFVLLTILSLRAQRGNLNRTVSSLVRVLKHLFQRHIEHVSDSERHFERGRITALLDGNDGLPGHADTVSQVGLGHLAVTEAQGTNVVGNPGFLCHDQNPRR